ncbi:hypothetical protein T492DRAFT_99420 [Pavlovales sp. CCMP2436]|nr:hypothetical protein T492DRAFT_99420 [Pavlovales sp. CCMP2436]
MPRQSALSLQSEKVSEWLLRAQLKRLSLPERLALRARQAAQRRGLSRRGSAEGAGGAGCSERLSHVSEREEREEKGKERAEREEGGEEHSLPHTPPLSATPKQMPLQQSAHSGGEVAGREGRPGMPERATSSVALHVKALTAALKEEAFAFAAADDAENGVKALQGRSLFLFAPRHPLRRACYAVLRSAAFENAVLVVIVLACITTALDEELTLTADPNPLFLAVRACVCVCV